MKMQYSSTVIWYDHTLADQVWAAAPIVTSTKTNVWVQKQAKMFDNMTVIEDISIC